MLGKLAKFLLVASSLAPILVTWAFADWRIFGVETRQVSALVIVVLLALTCWLVLTASRKRLTVLSFSTASIKTADQEIVGFLVAYLLPLISLGASDIEYATLGFVLALLALVVWSTNAFSVNPLLTLFGYHFYEVSNKDGVAFLMLSKREIRRSADLNRVVQLTRYVVLDPEESDG